MLATEEGTATKKRPLNSYATEAYATEPYLEN